MKQSAMIGALATSLIALCAFATPAAAGLFVSTYAQNGDEGNSVASTYNYDTQDNFNYYRAAVGAKRFGGCNPNSVCSASQGGTTDTSPSDTSSFSQTTLSDVDYGAPGNGASYARADITTAQLGVSVSGTYRSIFGDPGHGIGGHATAAFSDGLHFTVAGASANTSTNIGLNVILHGTFADDGHGGLFTSTNLINTLGFGNASYRTDDGLGVNPNTHQASGWASYVFAPDTAGDIVFSGIYTLQGASQDLGIFEQLITTSGYGGSSDFSHTSTLDFILPENVSFTSDSGAFLSAAPVSTEVPEPSTWGMFLLGLAAIGWATRAVRWNRTGA
jgi:hypothetical protein